MNVYLVKRIGDDKVVGLALESYGDWVGTSYALSGKSGASAPTTVGEVEAAIESGAVPIPPAAILRIVGMSQFELSDNFENDDGQEVYFEHALAV